MFLPVDGGVMVNTAIVYIGLLFPNNQNAHRKSGTSYHYEIEICSQTF